jgi:hypothetical protein
MERDSTAPWRLLEVLGVAIAVFVFVASTLMCLGVP